MPGKIQELYYIHNTTREPKTREKRRSLVGPERSTKNLYLGGGLLRVLRGRPSPVSKTILNRLAKDLSDKYQKGLVRVTNQSGQELDPASLLVVKDTVKRAPPPAPKVEHVAPTTAPVAGAAAVVPAPTIEVTEGEPDDDDDLGEYEAPSSPTSSKKKRKKSRSKS